MPRPYREGRDKYFQKPKSINSVPEIIDMFESVSSKLKLTDLRLLDGTPDVQNTPSEQTTFAVMTVFFWDLYEREGAAGLERALGPAMERLSPIVAREMKKREAAAAAQEKAAAEEVRKREGFNRPTKGEPPDKAVRPRKKRSSDTP